MIRIGFRNHIVAVFLGFFLVACASPNHRNENGAPLATDSTMPIEASKIDPVADSESLDQSANETANPQRLGNTVEASVASGEKPKKGDNIDFAFGKTGVDEQDKELLRRHATLLKANPRLVLTLLIFIDNQGSRAYNLALSEGWIDSIVGTLHTFGVQRRQIRTVSAGRRKNTGACTTPACRQQNQRVELIYKK